MAENEEDRYKIGAAPPEEWNTRIKAKIAVFFHKLAHPEFDFGGNPLVETKETLLYNAMMEDINASDVDAKVKEGLDVAPVIIALLAGAAGGGLSAILNTLLGPWLQTKLAYPLNRQVQPYRFDPGVIAELYRRGYPTEELKDKWWADLTDYGYDESRIDAIKELTSIIPPLADMVRFADFGSFDPKIIELWREFYDAPDWIKEPMSLIGIKGDWADKYWFSHWRQPGRYELGELHRRGLIDDELVKNAYLTQGFSSYWQEKLLALVKEPWTRVDVRRMWDMRTIDEAQLRKAYQAVGYYDEQLDGMILWTKVYVAFPDLLSRYKNGWISQEDVYNELVGLGMPPDRATELLQTKIVNVAAIERVAAERALTKGDITMMVKKYPERYGEGVGLLVDMGYDEFESRYIIDARVAHEGSPETPLEWQQLVNSYRRVAGMSYHEITEQALEAERLYLAKVAELEVARKKETPQADLYVLEASVEQAKVTYERLLERPK